MILGKIIGKSGTNRFNFLVTTTAKKFQYVQTKHSEGYLVLAQIVEIEKQGENTTAVCNILGYRDDSGVLKNLRTPLEPNSEVEYAEDDFVKKILAVEDNKNGAYIGVLEDREKIKVYLDLNKIISRHIAIIAKTGSGKSYFSGSLIEEVLQKNIPTLIIDPHGEYSTLKYPAERKESHKKFGIEPQGFFKQINEYSPDVEKNPTARALKLSAKNLTGSELMHLLPAKLSSSQIGLIYGSLSDVNRAADFDQLIMSLQAEENNAKWALINIIEYLKKLNIFSEVSTGVDELIQVGKCTILNLRGVPQEVQEIIVYKIVNDLFNARKQGIIPPFFLVVEESHNFCPERSFGETKSSNILRQLIAEGRKFGIGMAIISQRPARVDKTVLSQCNTHVIFKLTNPNDLKAISNSVEGITKETENEISNLHVGNAMIVGVADMPLFVNIRPRKTKHGGESIDIVGTFADSKVEHDTAGTLEQFMPEKPKWKENNKEVVSMIRPKVTKNEIKLLVDKKIKEIKSILIPCILITCNDNGLDYNLLINLVNGNVVTNTERGIGKNIVIGLDKLSDKENKILNIVILFGKQFAAAEIFAKSGLMFSEVYDIIKNLEKKQIFIKNGNNYELGDALKVFTNLKDYSCYEKNEFIGFECDEKLNPVYKVNDILDLIKRFTKIKLQKECYLVKYDVAY